MKIAVIVLLLTLTGCVTIGRKITGESPTGEKYEYKTSITAFGGGSVEKAAQAMRGEMKIFYSDGTPKVEVSLDSTQEGTGMSSNPEALLAGVELLGRMVLP